MQLYATEKFKKQYKTLPAPIKKQVKKQLALLMSNINHPSLNSKKMQDPRDIWDARISRSYRFTFQIKNDFYILRTVGTHDILKSP